VPSFAEMVEETIGLLNDWTGQVAQQCTLALALDPAALVLTVDDGQALGRGLVEVEEELVYVSAFDLAGNTGTIPPWGRGQQGTVAAAHPLGARVTTTPRPPRDRVKKALNQAVHGVYPDLFAVFTDEQPAAERAEYPLPAVARWVIDVQVQTTGLPVEWARARSWRLNTAADPTDFPTGVTLTLPETPTGYPIRTIYAAEPVPLVNAGDDFTTVTGLHAGVADLVVMAAASQLVLAQELSRGQLATVEQSQRTQLVSTGASMAASRFLRQEYGLRVAAEKRRLLALHPSRPHFEGV
jgi:hypothetical protein